VKNPKTEGFCDTRFVALRQQFEQLIAGYDQAGAAVAVFYQGQCVANLWGGFTDRARSKPWQQQTVVNIYSAGKGVMTLAVLLLVARGKLRLDDPVCAVWPEFAAHGKNDITLRHVLTHRSGLPAFSKPVAEDAIFDFDAMVQMLADETPRWPAGEKQAYHAFTFGWLVGEIIRRVTGKMPGQFITDEFAHDLFAPEPAAQRVATPIYVGVPPQHLGDVADVEVLRQPLPGAVGLQEMLGGEDPARFALTQAVFLNPPTLMSGTNRSAWRTAQIPGANAHASALALARLYNLSLIDHERWPLALMQQARREQSSAIDEVLLTPVRFGLGFMLEQRPQGPLYSGLAFGDSQFGDSQVGDLQKARAENAYGHPGAGGSIAFADTDRELAFAYVTRGIGGGTFGDVRSQQLIEVIDQILNDIRSDSHE